MGAVKSGDRILVRMLFNPANGKLTGPSGYLGAHVLQQLLDKGYRVRGTVRSERKINQIRKQYADAGDRLELVVVEDMQVDGAFDSFLDGSPHSLTFLIVDVDGICHVASPFHFKPQDNERDLLLPAIKGTTSLLNSALKAPSVKRIVITSTMATISHIGKGVWPGKVYNVFNSFARLISIRKRIIIQRHGRNVSAILTLISCTLPAKHSPNERPGNSSRLITPNGTLLPFIRLSS